MWVTCDAREPSPECCAPISERTHIRPAMSPSQTQRWPPELFPILATHCNSWVARKLRLLNKQASRLVTMDAVKCAHMLDYLKQYGPEATVRYIGELGEVAVLKRAMEKGLDIRIDNDVCLVIAAKEGHLNLVNALLAAGADVHGRGTLGVPFAPNMSAPLSKYYKEDSAFLWAVEKDHVEVARALLHHGANINAFGHLWAVRKAVNKQSVELSRLLLSVPGVVARFITVGDEEVCSAYHSGNEEMIQLLRSLDVPFPTECPCPRTYRHFY